LLGLVASASLAGLLGVSADPASAAYKAGIEAEHLTVTGDSAGDKLVIAFDPTSAFLDVGADGTADFTFDRALFTHLDVNAGGGNDDVRIIPSSGIDDAITVDGGSGNDSLFGSNAAETLIGNTGNDFVDGNQGNDRAVLGAGTDTFQWDPGDGSDVVEGGADRDAMLFHGSNIGENIYVSANGGRVLFVRNIATIAMDLDDVEAITFNALGGADAVIVNDLAGTDLRTFDANLAGFDGAGDAAADVVTAIGTNGDDTVTVAATGATQVLNGLSTQVRVSGGEAADDIAASLFGGADRAIVQAGVPGVATFDVDGGPDADTVIYNGTAAADTIAVTANGTKTRVDSAGTVPVDAVAERVVVNGLGGDDRTSGVGNLAALTSITMNGGSGNDTLLGSNGADTMIGGTGNDLVDGQQGNDLAQLGSGTDTFQWDPGDGSDVVEGGSETDTLAFNGSNIGEVFDLSPNGGRVRFTRNIAAIALDLYDVERTALNALGGADTTIVNDLSGTDMRLVDTNLAAFGGGNDAEPDAVVVNATSGPDAIRMATSEGSPLVDGLTADVRVRGGEVGDGIVVNALGGDDAITMPIGVPGAATVLGDGGEGVDTAYYDGTATADQIAVVANYLVPRVDAAATAPFEAAGSTESLVVRGLGGNDTISAVGNLAASATRLTFDGGANDDTLLGSNGPDLLLGNTGNDLVDGQQNNDVALLGSGNDTAQWDPGDGSDTIEGQAGTDTLQFNGANIGEVFDVSANGGRVRFTRNIAAITLDLDDVERANVKALGGADVVIVNDLAGTDLKTVQANLASTLGGSAGDGTADMVVVNGTNAPDVVKASATATQVTVAGLAAQTLITGSEAAWDELRVNTLLGDDAVTVTPQVGALILPVVDLGLDG
jgi:Ca2+-binding RTX toxin-like protein